MYKYTVHTCNGRRRYVICSVSARASLREYVYVYEWGKCSPRVPTHHQTTIYIYTQPLFD